MKRVQTILLAILLAGQSVPAQEKIIVKGSDTMVILIQRWAERYMSQHPGVSIQVSGGGSGSGIVGLIHGAVDICTSSRQMSLAEQERLTHQTGAGVVETACARDGLSFYVNIRNTVTGMTLEQLRHIFTGSITNWKVLGGANSAITLYGREEVSGTYAYVKENILRGADFSATTLSMPGTAAITLAVEHDSTAIGYGGLAYGKGVKEPALRSDNDWPAYSPTPQNIRDGTYPVYRSLYLYRRSDSAALIGEFIDWTLSEEAQGIVADVGYVPIR
jgi:phosphate transport system substrate-binding protein